MKKLIFRLKKYFSEYFEIATIVDNYEEEHWAPILHCADEFDTGCSMHRKRGYENHHFDCCPYCGGKLKSTPGKFKKVKTYNWSKFRGQFNVKDVSTGKRFIVKQPSKKQIFTDM